MPKLPRVSGAETIRVLERLGFGQIRQRGSHVVLKRIGSDGVNELAIGTLRGILKQAGVTADEFINKL